MANEARLWYESLRPIAVDQHGFQAQFSHQYPCINDTYEELCHAWNSLHFDENTETIENYFTHIRQVVALLGVGELQVLETFKNILSSIVYLVLFPIEHLRQAVEAPTRILAKEKRNGQANGRTDHLYSTYKYQG